MESVNIFPLPKLRDDTYLTLDVMTHLEYQEASKFMFAVNKEGRLFLLKKFITIRNEFINNGLISYEWRCNFDSSQ